MNIMNIPRFTAEASLYKTNGRYQFVATRGYSSGEQRVVSQIGAGGGGLGGSDGLGAWGCWKSECCTCAYHYDCNPFCHWSCCAEPCTRCIWPY